MVASAMVLWPRCLSAGALAIRHTPFAMERDNTECRLMLMEQGWENSAMGRMHFAMERARVDREVREYRHGHVVRYFTRENAAIKMVHIGVVLSRGWLIVRPDGRRPERGEFMLLRLDAHRSRLPAVLLALIGSYYTPAITAAGAAPLLRPVRA